MITSIEKEAVYRKQYYQKNRSEILKKKREYHILNRKTRNKKQQEYRGKNIKYIQDWMNAYYKRNSETMKKKQIDRSNDMRKRGLYALFQKKWALKKLYGLTITDYQRLIKKQKNLCAICKDTNYKKVLHVDHCHKTKAVRGLLCHKCNTGLGSFNDSVVKLSLAIKYLKNSNEEKLL